MDYVEKTNLFPKFDLAAGGPTEGVKQLIYSDYNGKELSVSDKAFALCKIAMPVDQKRNMMNAPSTFKIIQGILNAIRNDKKQRFLVLVLMVTCEGILLLLMEQKMLRMFILMDQNSALMI